MAEPDEAVAYLVEDRVAYGSLNLFSGRPKAGKSTAARDLTYAVATGGAWLGHRCQQGPVWYLALEEKRSEMRKHFRQLGARGDEPIRLFINQAPNDIIGQLRRPALIVIDTLARFLQGRRASGDVA